MADTEVPRESFEAIRRKHYFAALRKTHANLCDRLALIEKSEILNECDRQRAEEREIDAFLKEIAQVRERLGPG